ncbi:hypothetical protein OROGR_005175 [Orobanche gracilis]
MGRNNKPTTRDEETTPAGGGRGRKSKKSFMIADDEYLIGTELSEDVLVPEEKVAQVGGKNKGKKGGKKNELKDEDCEVVDSAVREGEEEDAPVITFGGKKKTKGKKGVSSSMFSASSFGLLGDGEDEYDHENKDDDDEPVIAFSGKKKPSSAFDLLGEKEENRDKDASSKEEDEDVEISFTGKKKKSSKGLKKPSGNSFGSASFDEENDEGGTNVREGEAGGITQQIGATYISTVNIRERIQELKADAKLDGPGLLVIDTPGHESFNNLRSRGSGLCDIAILVVDIMHGLEPQTIESLNLLRMRNTEFIIALNKVDRLHGWKTHRNAPIGTALKQQTRDVISEFNMRVSKIITQFMEQGVNTELYNKNKDRGGFFSIVPTSAVSGEGIPELLLLLAQWAQNMMIKRLTYSEKVQCSVLEVKVIEGHGTTIDVILVHGVLHEGDQIVVCGLQGPIVTSIRALLTPHPMRELRVKGTYLHYKEIKAAQRIKITAQVGTPICVRQREFIEIGRVVSIENNHKPVGFAKKGQKVAIKIISNNSEEQQKMFGRHFEIGVELLYCVGF